ADIWQKNAALFETTRTMPFNSELAAGTLSEERFRHYMIQDAHYLVAFGRALAIASAKADTPDEVVQFAHAAHDAVVVERSLHKSVMTQFTVTPDVPSTTLLRPTTEHNYDYLIGTASSAAFPVALVALMPCFRIYAEIGRYIIGLTAPNNPAQMLIDT